MNKHIAALTKNIISGILQYKSLNYF